MSDLEKFEQWYSTRRAALSRLPNRAAAYLGWRAGRVTDADVLRKQAEAVEAFAEWVDPHWPKSLATGIMDDAKSRAFELRQKADELERDQ